MKVIRNPKISAAMILGVTAFYSLVFIVTPGHIEFERLLNHSRTLSSPFWNGWSDFLARGNMKYVGYAYIVLALAVVVLSFLRKRDYDEYQAGLLNKGLIAAGIVAVCLFPLALLLILSDRYYAVEAILLLTAAHWSAVLLADLAYVVKWYRA